MTISVVLDRFGKANNGYSSPSTSGRVFTLKTVAIARRSPWRYTGCGGDGEEEALERP